MPPTPPKKSNWGRISKGLSFWILVILIPVAIIQFSGSRGEAAVDVEYTDYRDQLARDNVAKATVQDGSSILGDFRQKAVISGREVKRFLVRLPVKDSEKEIAALQEKNVRINAQAAKLSVGSFLITFLPYFLLIGFWIFLFRQMQAGGNKAFSFGKSKAKLLSGDTPKITFADVAGADEAKVELQEIIEFLRDPQKFTRLGGRLPKGALLVGPPGTGKTLLAKAVAGEAGRPFFSMSGSDFVEMFVGVGASRVRDLFE